MVGVGDSSISFTCRHCAPSEFILDSQGLDGGGAYPRSDQHKDSLRISFLRGGDSYRPSEKAARKRSHGAADKTRSRDLSDN